jgi:lipopolysaccharide export system protein LptA
MQSLIRDNPRRGLLQMLAACGLLGWLAPGLAASAPTAPIVASNKGPVHFNVPAGTQTLEDDVELRQAPDTLIRADKAEGTNLPDGNYDNGHWVLSGAVHIEFEGTVLDADSATVVFTDGHIHSIVVQGSPATFSHPTGTGERNLGRASTITYDGTRRQIRFTGHTAYSFGPYDGTADKPLLYSLDSSEIVSEKGPDDDSRIIFTFRNMQASARFWRANINRGTQLLEQDVELRHDPGTLIRAYKAEGSNLTEGYDNGHWNLTGKVRIEYDDAILDADVATVAFAAGDARSIQVHGAPARFSYPTRTGGQRFEGQADSVTFDGDKQQVRVIGHPSRYSFGIDQYSSDKPVLYELDSSVLHTEAGDDPCSSSCVRGTINPDGFVPAPRMPDRGTAQ